MIGNELSFEYEKKFYCRKCGWSGYTLEWTKNEYGEIIRGCPYCKTDEHIRLEN